MMRRVFFLGVIALGCGDSSPAPTTQLMTKAEKPGELAPADCGCARFDLACGATLTDRLQSLDEGQTLEEIWAGAPVKESPQASKLVECLAMVPSMTDFVATAARLASEACRCSSDRCMVALNKRIEDLGRDMNVAELDEVAQKEILGHLMRFARCAELVKYEDK